MNLPKCPICGKSMHVDHLVNDQGFRFFVNHNCERSNRKWDYTYAFTGPIGVDEASAIAQAKRLLPKRVEADT